MRKKLIWAGVWFSVSTIIAFLIAVNVLLTAKAQEEYTKFLELYGGFDGIEALNTQVSGSLAVLVFVSVVLCIAGIVSATLIVKKFGAEIERKEHESEE